VDFSVNLVVLHDVMGHWCHGRRRQESDSKFKFEKAYFKNRFGRLLRKERRSFAPSATIIRAYFEVSAHARQSVSWSVHSWAKTPK
jgi:hypothetical protein